MAKKSEKPTEPKPETDSGDEMDAFEALYSVMEGTVRSAEFISRDKILGTIRAVAKSRCKNGKISQETVLRLFAEKPVKGDAKK